MVSITPLILTFNESVNIGRTLTRLSWADNLIVLDSGSSDDTISIAQGFPNVRIYHRDFDSHAAQWNYGVSLIETEWVLALDADYELSDEFGMELQMLAPSDAVFGYEAKFRYRIHGRSLRSSAYPPHVVLFRRNRASYYDDGHTQKLRLSGEVSRLSGVIYHDDRKPLSRWLQSQDRYAQIEARHLLTASHAELKTQDRLRLAIFVAPPIIFVYLLFVRGLIFDGWPGWYYVMQRAIAEMLLSIRLLTERHGLELNE